MGILLLVLLLLMVGLWIALQNSGVQNRIANYLVKTLSSDLNTEISVDNVDIEFFKTISIDGFYIEDQQGDSLLYAHNLAADISVFSLYNRRFILDEIELEGARVFLSSHDSTTNYDFIVDYFSGDDTPSEKPPWEFFLSEVDIRNSYLKYSTPTTETVADLNSLTGEISSLDIENSSLALSQISMEDSDIKVTITGTAAEAQSTTASEYIFPELPWKIKVDDVALRNSKFSTETVGHTPQEGLIDPQHIGLNISRLDMRDINADSTYSLVIDNIALAERSGLKIEEGGANLSFQRDKIEVGNLILKTEYSNLDGELTVIYDDFSELMTAPEEILVEAQLSNTSIHSLDLQKLGAIIDLSKVDLSKGKRITLDTRINKQANEIYLTATSLGITETLQFQGDFRYTMRPQIADAGVHFDIKGLSTSADKLKSLIPDLELPEEVHNLGNIDLKARGQGVVSSLKIDTFNLRTETQSFVRGSGTVQGLPNMDSLRYDLNVGRAETLPEEITQDTTILTPEVRRLGKLGFTGAVSGGLRDYNINGTLNTDLGDLEADVELAFNSDFTEARYIGQTNLRNFQLQELLQDTLYGPTTLTARIDGSGMSLEDLVADIEANIVETTYRGERYENVRLDGVIKGPSFEGKVAVNNANTSLAFDGIVDLSNENPRFIFEMQLDTLNLKKLGITEKDFSIGGYLKSDIYGENLDDIKGSAVIHDFRFTREGTSFATSDSIQLKIFNLPGNNKNIILESPMVDAVAVGYIVPTEIIQTMKVFVDNYFPLGIIDTTYSSFDAFLGSYQRQSFDLSIRTKEVNPLIAAFTDQAIRVGELVMDASFDSYEPTLTAEGRIDSLQYGKYMYEYADIAIDGSETALNFNIFLENLYSGRDLWVPRTSIRTITQQDTADIAIDMKDDDGQPRFLIGSQVTTEDGYVKLILHDSLLINRSEWDITPSNFIKYKTGDLIINDLKLFRDNQNIAITTSEENNQKELVLDFNEFRITEILELVGEEADVYEGKIDGFITLNDLFNENFITADITVDSIAYRDKPVGVLSVQAMQNRAKNSIEGSFDMIGENNDALGSLEYFIKSGKMDGFLEVAKMEARLLDPFMTDIIEDSKGFIFGDFQIAGSIDQPDISGNVLLENASTVVSVNKTRYNVKYQRIPFDSKNIDFGEVELTDEDGNITTLTGNISHEYFSNMYLQLEAETNGTRFLSTTAADNPLFYGDVFLTGTAEITGPPQDLQINAVARAVKNSTLTLSPFASVDELISDDFIVFGNPDELKKDTVNKIIFENEYKYPFDADIRLEVEDDSEFTFVVDPITGDRLKAYGSANLNIKVLKNGDIEIYGPYTATSGSYIFSYAVIEREFEIKEGGTVRFNGNPLQAQLDIEAVYSTNTDIYELVKSELSSDSDIAQAKRRSEVQVVLNLSGEMLKPVIKLDIAIPQTRTGSLADVVQRKLLSLRSNPNELNNQVFGLMLFDSFITSDNAIGGLDNATESIVLGSVSSLITNQLNKIASGLISGVEVNFDVQNYTSRYTDQGDFVTELGVDVSKQLFNDRLTLRAGGNFNLESSESYAEFSTLAGDFILEYKLNERGNYVLKVFNETNYDRLIDENNNKTGVGIFIKKELD